MRLLTPWLNILSVDKYTFQTGRYAVCTRSRVQFDSMQIGTKQFTKESERKKTDKE